MVIVDVDAVVSRIYEAVSDSDRWVVALDEAKELLEADAMLLLYSDLAMGGPKVIASTGFDDETLSTYMVYHLADDELICESMELPAGVIVSRTYSWEDATTRTTIMRRGILNVNDPIQIAGAAALKTSDVYSSLWMVRSHGKTDFSCRDLHVFGELLPHVGRAMTVHHRVTRAELEATMATGAIDRMAVGVVLLDATGMAVIVNREAQRLFAAQDGIGMVGRKLIAIDSNQTKRLSRLIRRVGCSSDTHLPADTTGGATIRLKRLNGRLDYHVVVLPLPRRCQPENAAGAVAVLFVTDPERGQSPVDFLCGDLYGLTVAEVRLVTSLLENNGLTAAATDLGLSRNTVHSQLASVFQKTGTRSQSQLLRLILGGIAPVRPPEVTSGFSISIKNFKKTED
jgi:DNA-binding CsgD family transcriptional regulator